MDGRNPDQVILRHVAKLSLYFPNCVEGEARRGPGRRGRRCGFPYEGDASYRRASIEIEEAYIYRYYHSTFFLSKHRGVPRVLSTKQLYRRDDSSTQEGLSSYMTG